jgi:hypothetical protein
MNLKKVLKKVLVAYSRYYTGICLEGMIKLKKNLSSDSRCPPRLE